MKATIEIVNGQFEVSITTSKTSYQSKGTIVLDEDASDMRNAIESLAKHILTKSSNLKAR
jgi:hypothetical protein